MIYELVIKEEANLEIIESYLYYELKYLGLGDRFENQLEEYFDRITKFPFHFEMKRKPYREAFIKKFPFVIIYEVIENVIVVYSVFNTNRNPLQKPFSK
jgi:ParE toxin of type II toxin-antitoxin system, parDE